MLQFPPIGVGAEVQVGWAATRDKDGERLTCLQCVWELNTFLQLRASPFCFCRLRGSG